MLGKIYRYLADDHRRLDALLERAMSDPENIDAAAYAQFRSGLLKHIGVEEKVLLVPWPTAPVVAAIRAIFKVHNPIEEPGGMYDHCEQLAEAERGIRYWSRCTLTVLEFVLGSMGGRDLRRLRHLSASRSGLDGFGQRRCFHAI